MVAEVVPPAVPPLRADLFAENVGDDRGSALRGGRCKRCDRRFFPRRADCPACPDGGAMVDHVLDRRGVVYASTVARVGSSLGHRPPYAYGYVDIPADGVRVLAPLSGDAPESFRPGRKVELATMTMALRGKGEVLAFCFVPGNRGPADA